MTAARSARAALALAAGALACGAPRPAPERGGARVTVSAAPLAAAAVADVLLEVIPQAAGAAPVTKVVALASGQGEARLADLVVGAYTFRASARADDGTVLFGGETTGAVAARQTLAVTLLLQQAAAPQPFSDVAPRVASLVASTALPRSGQEIALAATASDEDDGAALSYAWEIACPDAPGASSTFSDPSAASTRLTSTCLGVTTVVCRVSDPRGATSSASLALLYQPPNAPPAITGFSPPAPQVAAGGSLPLGVTASDADGDPLTYAWTSDCGGAFSTTDAAAVIFQAPAEVPASGACQVTASASDPYGATASATVAVVVTAALYPVSVTPVAASTYTTTCGSYVCGSYCCSWNSFWGSCSGYCSSYCTRYCSVPVPFTVVSTPPGIACSVTQSGQPSGTCSAAFPVGTSVTLSASGTTFSGDCAGAGGCTFTVTGPASVTATH